MTTGDPVEVARCNDSFQAQTIIASLRAAGIEALVAGDPFIGGRADTAPYWSVRPGPRILVRPEQAQEARDLISANQNQSFVIDLTGGSPRRLTYPRLLLALVILGVVLSGVVWLVTLPFR